MASSQSALDFSRYGMFLAIPGGILQENDEAALRNLRNWLFGKPE